MKVDRDNLQLCDECTVFACNGDVSSLDSYLDEDDAIERQSEIEDGCAALGPHLVPDFDSETGDGIQEFSWNPCDACGTDLGGGRHRFATLTED